jgi:hypothetical protein
MQPTSSPPANLFRWGTGDLGLSPRDTRSASFDVLAARDAPALARPIPRHDPQGAGFEPALPWCEVSEIFTTSEICLVEPAALGEASRPTLYEYGSGGTIEVRWPEGASCQRSNEARHHPEQTNICRGAEEIRAPPSEP